MRLTWRPGACGCIFWLEMNVATPFHCFGCVAKAVVDDGVTQSISLARGHKRSPTCGHRGRSVGGLCDGLNQCRHAWRSRCRSRSGGKTHHVPAARLRRASTARSYVFVRSMREVKRKMAPCSISWSPTAIISTKRGITCIFHRNMAPIFVVAER